PGVGTLPAEHVEPPPERLPEHDRDDGPPLVPARARDRHPRGDAGDRGPPHEDVPRAARGAPDPGPRPPRARRSPGGRARSRRPRGPSALLRPEPRVVLLRAPR